MGKGGGHRGEEIEQLHVGGGSVGGIHSLLWVMLVRLLVVMLVMIRHDHRGGAPKARCADRSRKIEKTKDLGDGRVKAIKAMEAVEGW